MSSIDSEIKSKFTSEQHRFVTNLVYTANWIQQTFNKSLKPYGISPQQFNILRVLKSYGDWTSMSEIKDGLLEKSPNATRLADKLLKKSLIERRPSEDDRRVVYVRISKSGLSLFDAISKDENKIQQAIKNNITVAEAKYAGEILDKFRG